MSMSAKEYIEYYSVEMTADLSKIFTIIANSGENELSKDDYKKIMGICKSIEKISTVVNNKAYSEYIN